MSLLNAILTHVNNLFLKDNILYFTIYAFNPEQEKFFRESIYGGRTYKYKHSFTSSQREAFMKNKISFEGIDDYLIDADVNSLYPAAMMKEFPIGVAIHEKQAVFFSSLAT